jgi:hypothetical protein
VHRIVRERLPILPNSFQVADDLSSIPSVDDRFSSVPRAIVSVGEFDFAFGSAPDPSAIPRLTTSYERIQAGMNIETMDYLRSDELDNSDYSAMLFSGFS